MKFIQPLKTIPLLHTLEHIHGRRLVLPRQPLLVSDSVHRNVFVVLVGQLLNSRMDGLHESE